MAFIPPTNVVPFPFWNAYTPTLPEIYWDVDSHEERIKKLCLMLHKLVEYADYLGKNINLDHDTINQLLKDFEKFKESGFFDYYAAQIEQWIRDNFNDLMKQILNQGIFFGLTDDGYFCANVAYQLTFVLDTIVDYSNDNYGRLTITY